MIRAVIFDMGSTLLRYVRPGDGSWREFELPGIRGVYRYLIEQGHPIESHEDEFAEAMFARLAEGWEQSTGGHISLRATELIATSIAPHNLTLDEARLLEAAHHYARPLRDGVSETPGAAATLATLREQGLGTGMISNTIWPGELHLEDLAELNILPQLQHVLFSGDYGVWKPRPEVFRHMLALLDVTPAEAIFVGDSPREDILGAQGVGMRAVWMRSREFLLDTIRPDATIESLPELLPIIEEWQRAS